MLVKKLVKILHEHGLYERFLNEEVEKLWEDYHRPEKVYGNMKTLRRVHAWDRSRLRTYCKADGDHQYMYLTDIGIEVILVPTRDMPRDELVLEYLKDHYKDFNNSINADCLKEEEENVRSTTTN